MIKYYSLIRLFLRFEKIIETFDFILLIENYKMVIYLLDCLVFVRVLFNY